MDERREHLLRKVQSITLPWGNQHSFTGEHPQTDKEFVASLSLLLLSLVIITQSLLMRIGEVLLCAGAATLLSDFIYPLFSQNCSVKGVVGKGRWAVRRYPPSLRAPPDVRHICLAHVIQLMLNGCTAPLLKKSQRPCHKQFAMSCTLAQAGPVPTLRDSQWQGCAAAEPCCESLFVSVKEWPNPIMQQWLFVPFTVFTAHLFPW